MPLALLKPSVRADREAGRQSLTSYSNGPGKVSSKSLTSNNSSRSGEANAPKFERCASPHTCTSSPAVGVPARSTAMIFAAPRKKVNGEAIIRPCRIGTRSGSRAASCACSNATGSGRSAAGTKSSWASGGVRVRASLPCARRSATSGCATFRPAISSPPEGQPCRLRRARATRIGDECVRRDVKYASDACDQVACEVHGRGAIGFLHDGQQCPLSGGISGTRGACGGVRELSASGGECRVPALRE